MGTGLFRRFYASSNVHFRGLGFFFYRFSQFVRSFFVRASFSSVVREEDGYSRNSNVPVRVVLFNFLHRSLRGRLHGFIGIGRVTSTLSISGLRGVARGVGRRLTIFLFFISLHNGREDRPALLHVWFRNIHRALVGSLYVT